MDISQAVGHSLQSHNSVDPREERVVLEQRVASYSHDARSSTLAEVGARKVGLGMQLARLPEGETVVADIIPGFGAIKVMRTLRPSAVFRSSHLNE